MSPDGIIISLQGHFTINRVVYENPIVAARLLTVKEIQRINYLDIEHPVARMQIEEDILNNVFREIVGVGNSIDWEECEAGLVETIVNSIVLTSISYVSDSIKKYEDLIGTINVINSMCAIISRFLSTPFSEVEQLPINEIFRRYAICVMAFPKEVMPIQEAQEDDGED